MKAFRFIIALSLFLFTSSAVFGQEISISEPETLLQETQLQNLNFDALSEQASKEEAGGLLSHLNGPDADKDDLISKCFRRCGKRWKIFPMDEGFTYIRGEFCHVANYPYSTIITVLEGYNAGLQTMIDCYGYVLGVNYATVIEYVYGGVVFKHVYPDCVVVTGSNQVIIY